MLLLAINCYSQETELFNWPEPITYKVMEVDSFNAEQLYLKTIDWIKETYRNPDEVIKAKFENEKVRFNGFKENAITAKVLGMRYANDARYSIAVAFKEGRFKFEPINLEIYYPASQYSSGGWFAMALQEPVGIYRKNGNLKKMYEEYPESINGLFNSLYLSLYTYILKENGTTEDKKDDW